MRHLLFLFVLCISTSTITLAQNVVEGNDLFEKSATLGIELYGKEQYGEALTHLLNCKRILNQNGIKEGEEYLSFLKAIANCTKEICDTTNYIENCEEISHIAEKGNADQCIPYMINLSDLYFQNNKYDDVIRIQLKLLDLYHEYFGIFNEYTENASVTIASCYSNKKDYVKAIEWHLKVIEITKAIKGTNNETCINENVLLASYYGKINDFATSLKYNKEAVAIARGLYDKKDSRYADVLGFLAQSYFNNGDYDNAIKNELESLEIRKESLGVDHPDYWLSLSNLSTFYESSGYYDKSIDIAKQVIRYYSNSDNIESILSSLNNYAIKFVNTSPQKGVDILTQAIKTFKSIDKYGDLYWTLFINLSELYGKLSDFDSAAESMNNALEFAKKQFYKDYFQLSSASQYYYWGNYWLYFHRVFPYLICMSKNDALYGKLYDTSALFPKIAFNESSKNSEMDLPFQTYSWENIKERLDADEIAIEFINFYQNNSKWYYALILRKDSNVPHFVQIATEDDITKTPDNQLYSVIWKPLMPFLDGIRKVYFSSVGILDAKNIEYWLPNNNHSNDTIEVYRLSSTAFLLKNNIKTNTKKEAALFGGLSYNIDDGTKTSKSRAGFDYLPNSLLEIKEIGKILDEKNYKTKLYAAAEGTEKTFKKLSEEEISIIHIATHALYINEESADDYKEKNNFSFIQTGKEYDITPEQIKLSYVGLVMAGGNLLPYRMESDESDGVLTGDEISKLNLKGTDLVVLSTCESGFGNYNQEKLIGLRYAFKKAGVNTIIMSLEKVDDEAAKILMVEFYRNLMSGKTKLQSLQKAQQHLRQVESGKYDDPKYWASFIMLDGLD